VKPEKVWDMGEYISWTSGKLALFKKAFSKAVNEEKEVFSFEGHDFLVAYAKYLIEYLSYRFNGH